MKKTKIFHFLKIIFSIWGLQLFAPFFTSIGSVSHPGYLPFLCSNGKYCIAEMDGKKVGECQWDELIPLGKSVFVGKKNNKYFLVGPKQHHLLGYKIPTLELSGPTIKDTVSGLHAVYIEESNSLGEFIFTDVPMRYSGSPFYYGTSKDGLLLYNMENKEKYFAQGDEITLRLPYAFIKRENLWIAHDLQLNMLFPEGRPYFLVHNKDLVLYDEKGKNEKINPLFFDTDTGLYAVAEQGFTLLVPSQYLGYSKSRSEKLIAYLLSEDGKGNKLLHYPDKSLFFKEGTEWFYEFGKIYWKTDSNTGMLSYDRLGDVVIPERIDSVNLRQKLFIKYLNESRDSFRVYDADLNVSGDMRGHYFTLFWKYFLLTIEGKDSLAICRIYDWKGNLIKTDNVSEIESFRLPEAGKTIIKYYGDTLANALDLPEFCRKMTYAFDYDINIYGDSKLYGWNEYSRFSYDLNSNHLITEFIPVDQPNPNVYRDYLKLPEPPPYTYRDFSVTKFEERYLINCTKPEVNCSYEADEYEVGEFDSESILIVTDFETSKTTSINSEGKVLYYEDCNDDLTVWAFYGDNLLTIEDDRTDTTFISVVHSSGDTVMWNAILELPEMDHDFIYFREKESSAISLYVIGSNVKILEYNKCPLLADSLQGGYAYLFKGFGLINTYYTDIGSFPILKYPWVPRSDHQRENSQYYAETDLGRVYINIYAPNPYFADPDIIQKVSFEGRVIDCSGN